MNRRDFIASLAAAFLAQNAQAQAPDAELQTKLNGDLGKLRDAANKMPEIQNMSVFGQTTLPLMEIRVVRNDDIHPRVVRGDLGAQSPAIIIVPGQALDQLKPDQQTALVASAFATHVLKLYPEKLKELGMTSHSRAIIGDESEGALTRKEFALPMRADELAVKWLNILEGEKPNQLNKNSPKIYCGMLISMNQLQEDTMRAASRALAEQPTLKIPRNVNGQIAVALEEKRKLEQRARNAGMQSSDEPRVYGDSRVSNMPIAQVSFSDRIRQISDETLHPGVNSLSPSEIPNNSPPRRRMRTIHNR